MSEVVKGIIEKYTGGIVDEIPDRFLYGQDLEIRQLIRFIQKSTIIENNCELHSSFTGEFCPVCLIDERNNFHLQLAAKEKEILSYKDVEDSLQKEIERQDKELVALKERLRWALTNLESLVIIDEENDDAFIRGTTTELVGFVKKLHEAQDLL